MSMRSIYRKIAREHGVTVAEVKHDMQEAITHAYTNTPNDGVTGACQNQVPRRGEIPTPEEFVKFCTRKVKSQQ